MIALLVLAIAGCDSANTDVVPFSSLDAATQAKYAADVRRVIAKSTGDAFVYFAEADLEKHPRDAAYLMRLGYVATKSGKPRFTARGRSASSRCDRGAIACAAFKVGRTALVSILSVRLHTIPLQTLRTVVTKLRLRTTVTTAFGRGLLGATDLTCESDGTLVPWDDAATETDGIIYLQTHGRESVTNVTLAADDLVQDAADTSFLEASCPSFPGQFTPIF